MIEMTLPSRHRIRNSNPGGLRPSSLLLGEHVQEGSPQFFYLYKWAGKETFWFLKTWLPERDSNPRYPNSKQIALTAALQRVWAIWQYTLETIHFVMEIRQLMLNCHFLFFLIWKVQLLSAFYIVIIIRLPWIWKGVSVTYYLSGTWVDKLLRPSSFRQILFLFIHVPWPLTKHETLG